MAGRSDGKRVIAATGTGDRAAAAVETSGGATAEMVPNAGCADKDGMRAGELELQEAADLVAQSICEFGQVWSFCVWLSSHPSAWTLHHSS
eukprot:m.189707 g.189707  ORF g.189707 m.189707 type:complete len:91 (-) comp15115_c0_seq3:549-821(-)